MSLDDTCIDLYSKGSGVLEGGWAKNQFISDGFHLKSALLHAIRNRKSKYDDELCVVYEVISLCNMNHLVVRRKVFITGKCTIDLRFVMLQTSDCNCCCPESITNKFTRRHCKHVLQTACSVVRLTLFWAEPIILLLWGQLVRMRCPHNRFAFIIKIALLIECISLAKVLENLL